MEKAHLTQQWARGTFGYDESSGVLFWLADSWAGQYGSRLVAAAGEEVGGIDKDGYRVVRVAGHLLKVHRVIWLMLTGEWPNGDIDHIDGNRTNNKRINLRACPRLINMQNLHGAKSSNKTTGLLGASLCRSTGLFKAQIRHNGKQLSLGRYDTPEEAHSVYLEAKRRLHAGCTI